MLKKLCITLVVVAVLGGVIALVLALGRVHYVGYNNPSVFPDREPQNVAMKSLLKQWVWAEDGSSAQAIANYQLESLVESNLATLDRRQLQKGTFDYHLAWWVLTDDEAQLFAADELASKGRFFDNSMCYGGDYYLLPQKAWAATGSVGWHSVGCDPSWFYGDPEYYIQWSASTDHQNTGGDLSPCPYTSVHIKFSLVKAGDEPRSSDRKPKRSGSHLDSEGSIVCQ